MKPLRSVDHSNAVEKAYAFIKESILTLKLRHRDRVATQELAERLGISRTPVREALARLEQEGLLVRDAGWGYVVPAVTTSEVLYLYRVREALEIEVIRETIDRVDEPLITVLTTLIERAEGHVRARRYSDLQAVNRQFYGLIAQTTGNALLQQMLRTISDRIRIVGALVIEQYTGRAAEVIAENRRVLEALKARNGPQAEEAVREHIRRARDHVLAYFAG